MYDEQTKTWKLELNYYQRANLLWLLNCCGFPSMSDAVEPLSFCNTGDWLAEIGYMLGDNQREGRFHPEMPNISKDDLETRIKIWR